MVKTVVKASNIFSGSEISFLSQVAGYYAKFIRDNKNKMSYEKLLKCRPSLAVVLLDNIKDIAPEAYSNLSKEQDILSGELGIEKVSCMIPEVAGFTEQKMIGRIIKTYIGFGVAHALETPEHMLERRLKFLVATEIVNDVLLTNILLTHRRFIAGFVSEYDATQFILNALIRLISVNTLFLPSVSPVVFSRYTTIKAHVELTIDVGDNLTQNPILYVTNLPWGTCKIKTTFPSRPRRSRL